MGKTFFPWLEPKYEENRETAINNLCTALNCLNIKYRKEDRDSSLTGEVTDVIFTMDIKLLDKIGKLI